MWLCGRITFKVGSYICPMTLQDLRIVFMGTPEFAVASLDALVQAGCNVVGVITAPDKPAGRGMQLTQSAVKKYAVEKGLYTLQPEKLKNPAFLAELNALNANIQVVVAFRMLPEIVWSMPPMGTINVHGSLLPQYRGAAPINWAIINGETETGVTTFKLQHAIDTGNILLQQTIPIPEDATVGDIHDAMKEIGAATLVKTMQRLAEGSIKEVPQEISYKVQNSSNKIQEDNNANAVSASPFTIDLSLKHAPKIFTETCVIDWHKSAAEIHNLIRGLSPYPAAFTTLNNKKLKVFKSKKETTSHSEAIGSVITDTKTYLKFSCADGFIHVLDMQLEGKKRLLVEEFLRGYRA
ncbi:MAG: methionyl-tRNA formyltransferase [Flavobacterium sp.]|nr:methionyl-tRNA formyltransferase [Flavobacterium sp.]